MKGLIFAVLLTLSSVAFAWEPAIMAPAGSGQVVFCVFNDRQYQDVTCVWINAESWKDLSKECLADIERRTLICGEALRDLAI